MAIFKDVDRDVLREVGNIGSGHASVAMSLLTDQKTHISHTQADFTTPRKSMLDEMENRPDIVHVGIEGDLSGDAFLFLFKDTSAQIVRLIKSKKINLSKIDNESILTEFGNIMVGSYLNAISNLVNLAMRPKVPLFITNGDADHLVRSMHPKKKTISIKTRIFIAEEGIEAKLAMSFTQESLKKILNRTKLRNILVIDRSIATRRKIERAFSSFGNIKVYSAPNLKASETILSKTQPHLSFIDQSSGEDAIKRLNKPGTRIIVMSSQRMQKKKLASAGATVFLKKPLKNNELVSLIDGIE